MAKLMYLPVRARAEPIRLLLAYKSVKYEDIVYDFPKFRELKEKKEFPYGQVPVLEVEGTKIAQLGSIMRFLALKYNLVPSDPVKAAVCDSLHELAQELMDINPIVNVYTGEKKEKAREAFFAKFSRYCETLTSILGDKPQFLMGAEVTYCDFTLFHVIDNALFESRNCLDMFPTIRDWYNRVALIPTIAAYLHTRPEVKTPVA